jgi:hypothetical protein
MKEQAMFALERVTLVSPMRCSMKRCAMLHR